MRNQRSSFLQRSFKIIKLSLCRENGYALPSVLFLITILSVVILSILALQYFQRQNIQTAAAKVKADYAAQSGISKILSEMRSKSDLPLMGHTSGRSYDLNDGEKVIVTLEWWGFYLYVHSVGSFRRINETRFALVGQIPAGRFTNSLVFSNMSHQLVLTGSTHIKGDVMVGPAGVSIGTLSKHPTPRIMPVEGKIKRDPKIDVQDIDIEKRYEYFISLLGGGAPQSIEQAHIQQIQSEFQVHLSNRTIKPETKYVFVRGNALIDSVLSRRDAPLIMVIDGEVSFGPNAQIDGIVCIVSSQSIKIPSTAHIDGSILYSRTEIIVEPGANISAQIISPAITIESGAKMLYPSVLISYIKKDNNYLRKGVQVKGGAQFEGTIVVSTEDKKNNEVLMNIESGAAITGFVISNAPMTFDGSVEGCVQAKDFYFYESPTAYYGWLRSARIDREALPKSALMTVGIDSLAQLQVLDWL